MFNSVLSISKKRIEKNYLKHRSEGHKSDHGKCPNFEVVDLSLWKSSEHRSSTSTNPVVRAKAPSRFQVLPARGPGESPRSPKSATFFVMSCLDTLPNFTRVGSGSASLAYMAQHVTCTRRAVGESGPACIALCPNVREQRGILCPSSSFPLHSHHTSSQSICQEQWRNVQHCDLWRNVQHCMRVDQLTPTQQISIQ